MPTREPCSDALLSGICLYFIYTHLSSPGSLTFTPFPAPVKMGFHALFTINRYQKCAVRSAGRGFHVALPDFGMIFHDLLPTQLTEVKTRPPNL